MKKNTYQNDQRHMFPIYHTQQNKRTRIIGNPYPYGKYPSMQKT